MRRTSLFSRLRGMAVLRPLRAALAGLRRDRRGNVMMIMGFALIPLVFATGMAIDYSRAARLQTKLNAAADAAALSGTTKPMLEKPMLAACNSARRTFLNALQQQSNGLVFDANANPAVTITETYTSLPELTITCPNTDVLVPSLATLPISRTIKVSYAGRSTNSFGGVLRKATIDIGGTATARSSIGQFIDIHMALDTSQSMGLAASDADAQAMWNKTRQVNGPNNGCTFGCHIFQSADGGYNASRKANEVIASENGIKLRIDSLRSATMDMIDEAIEAQGSVQRYRFGLYRIGADTTVISPLSYDLSGTRTIVQGLKLGPNTAAGTGDTNLQDMAKSMLDTITTHGDGTTAATSAAFLFIVTDGVQDIVTSSNSYMFGGTSYNCEMFAWNHCTSVIKPADCALLKARNITVGVVYTTYLPVRTDPANRNDYSLRHEYSALVQDLAPNIKPQLQACASDSRWFLEASDGPGIETAMRQLLTQAIETSRLTR